MSDGRRTQGPAPRVTAPRATALLLAVHAVRERLHGEVAHVRHLTQLLASAAGVPAMASAWRADRPVPDPDVMAAVRAGLTGRRSLEIQHLQQDGELRTLRVDPYHVRLETGYWYLLSRLSDDGTERVLRLDRVVKARVGEPYQPRPLDLDRYLGGVFVPPEAPQVATVRFGPRSAVYAQERWGLGRETEDGGAEVPIPYDREHFLVRQLAEFGDDYEVLAPPALREGVRARAVATLARYAPRADD